ncbi:MAG: glycine betaine ABC transporter substrate-binding protein [Desulfobacterales bacterium]
MKRMKWIGVFLAFTLTVALAAGAGIAADKELVVGSKNFTEQRILSDIMIQLLEKHGFETVDKTGLGGTLVARTALENRQIDIYMEYTGTALVTMLKEKEVITDPQECYDFVKKADLERNGLVWLPMMPFNNTYCLMMRKDDAEAKGIKTLSDLSAYVKANPDAIRFGTNEEFYARPDGYKPLQQKYDFKFPRDKIIKMTPGLLYKALNEEQIDVAMGFATDGRIKGFDLLVLEDDQNFFPVYNPAPVVKKEIADKYPELESIFSELAKHLDTQSMTDLNYAVDGEHKAVKEVVSEWLKGAGLI